MMMSLAEEPEFLAWLAARRNTTTVEAALRQTWNQIRSTPEIAGHLGRAWPQLAQAAAAVWERERDASRAMAEFLLREKAKVEHYDQLAHALAVLIAWGDAVAVKGDAGLRALAEAKTALAGPGP